MKVNKAITFFILILLSLLFILASINIGAKSIPIEDIFKSIFFYDGSLNAQLVRDVRIPRALSAFLNGGILSICGGMLQGVMRNPLSDPSIIGITQGGAFGISLLYLIPISFGLYGTFFMGLLGSTFSGIIILLLLRRSSIVQNISKVLLASTAMSTLFISIASIISLLKNKSQELAFFISGSFNQSTWVHVISLILVGSIFIFLSAFMIKDLNVLSLGDENAISLGVSPSKARIKIISIVIPLCAICVATAGNISFLGLIVPHIVRKLVGGNYKDILPFSFILGGILLVLSDIIGRTIISPYELPVGIFTSIIGIPIFLMLVRKENR